jgi:hypothetical protein
VQSLNPKEEFFFDVDHVTIPFPVSGFPFHSLKIILKLKIGEFHLLLHTFDTFKKKLMNQQEKTNTILSSVNEIYNLETQLMYIEKHCKWISKRFTTQVS